MSITPDKLERFYEASFEVSREIHELVCNFIIENFAGGVILEEEDDAPTIGIKFYLPESKGLSFRESLARYINNISGQSFFNLENIKTKTVVNVEWEQAYKESIKPIVIENVVIRPPWVSYPATNKIELIIEPKMAFGTGSHETTKLCIREILRFFEPGWSMFDLGCGSGILSILAAKLGAKHVKGVDIDLVAVENAGENIIINGVTDRVKIEFGSIEKANGDGKYDFFAGNLIKSSIVELYGRIDSIVKSGGIILFSGLLFQDKDAMTDLLDHQDITGYEINQDGQWLAYTIFKK